MLADGCRRGCVESSSSLGMGGSRGLLQRASRSQTALHPSTSLEACFRLVCCVDLWLRTETMVAHDLGTQLTWWPCGQVSGNPHQLVNHSTPKSSATTGGKERINSGDEVSVVDGCLSRS